MFLPREDMQAIIMAAFSFVNVQTSYRNNLFEWVDQCKTVEEVVAITYGVVIPEKYQNEVYRSHMIQQEEAGNEENA